MPRQSIKFNAQRCNREETTLLVFALLIQLCYGKNYVFKSRNVINLDLSTPIANMRQNISPKTAYDNPPPPSPLLLIKQAGLDAVLVKTGNK